MKQLLLLRHAKSDQNIGLPDKQRPLSTRGINEAPVIGKFLLDKNLIPDTVICSTSTRTRETLKLVFQEIPQNIKIEFSDLIYENNPDKILTLIAGTSRQVDRLMIIGHNPSTEELAGMLTGFNFEKYGTSGLALIEFSLQEWSEIFNTKGELKFYTSAKILLNAK